jgi:hypothetical protein
MTQPLGDRLEERIAARLERARNAVEKEHGDEAEEERPRPVASDLADVLIQRSELHVAVPRQRVRRPPLERRLDHLGRELEGHNHTRAGLFAAKPGRDRVDPGQVTVRLVLG